VAGAIGGGPRCAQSVVRLRLRRDAVGKGIGCAAVLLCCCAAVLLCCCAAVLLSVRLCVHVCEVNGGEIVV
jgi:hypothetical protein